MRLSVISIAYNNLKGLQKTLAVFNGQNLSDQLEIVVVDGGSKDGTKEFLEAQNLTNNWISEPDKGIYNAMNKGLDMAKGDYVWFLNSGDYVEDYAVIDKLLNFLNKGPDAVYGETMMVDADGKHLGLRSEFTTRKLPNHLTWTSFRMGMNVGHQSFVIKRSLALPYNEKYRYVADIDWMIRCLKPCKKVLNLNAVLACFTVDGFSSVQRKASNKERYEVLKEHYGFIPNVLAHIGVVLRKVFSKGKA
jgi:glycosyltransferase involved in cell wall biosynthesis